MEKMMTNRKKKIWKNLNRKRKKQIGKTQNNHCLDVCTNVYIISCCAFAYSNSFLFFYFSCFSRIWFSFIIFLFTFFVFISFFFHFFRFYFPSNSFIYRRNVNANNFFFIYSRVHSVFVTFLLLPVRVMELERFEATEK